MRLISLLLLIACIILAINTKGITKQLTLSKFNQEGPFIFLTKFRIGAGFGQMDMTYRKGEQVISQAFYSDLSVGMVNSTVYNQFAAATSCQDKAQYIYKREKMHFRQERYGMKHVKLYDLEQEQLWYFYMYSCMTVPEINQSNQKIELTFTVSNNGAHFAQHEHILYFYVILVVVWICLIVKFAMPMGSLLSFKKPDGLKLSIFGGLLILGMAYFYRLIHLILIAYDGLGIHFFQILYIILKNVGETIISTMIVSLSWGWSILHLKSGSFYFLIGTLTGLINIVSLALSSLTQQTQQIYHQYETTPGLIVLGLRIVLLVVFVLGILHCLRQSSTKIVYFIKKFAFVGGFYLLCWPVTVFLVESTFPDYMHKEIITFIEEIVHICATTVLCTMISSPQSAYRKVSLQQDDNPFKMNDYHKR